MELWFDFVLGLTSSLGWPIVVALLAFLFRHPLRNLLNSVKSIRIREVEIELDWTKETIESQAPDIHNRKISPEISKQLNDIADQEPLAAIIDSWDVIRKAVRDSATANGISLTNYLKRSTPRITVVLEAEGILSEDMVRGTRMLQRLRNMAGRGEFNPTRDFALEYIDTVELFLTVLEHDSSSR